MMAVESRTAFLQERLRDIGLRITPQRMAVVDVVSRRRDHPTPKEIFGEVRERYPTTARSTVSKTLNLLNEMGEIRELRLQDGTVRICSRGDPHAHLICTRCSGVSDLRGEKIASFERMIIRESGYLVTDSDIKFYGFCETCR